MFTLTGTLKDHAGKPVADSAVVIIPSPSMTKDASGNTVYLGGTTVYTDANGNFTASLVADEGNLIYTVRSAYGGPLGQPIHFDSPADDVTIDLADVVPVQAPDKFESYVVGASAYEVAVRNGFSGTEAQWLDSLKGNVDIQVGGTQPASGWWLHTGQASNEVVVPTGPTWTDNAEAGGGTWSTPSQEGVIYTPASGTATPGQSVTVTASAVSGYVLSGASSWTHTFPPAPPPPPLLVDDFERVVASGLGTADSGQEWATVGTWSVNGTEAVVTTSNASALIDVGTHSVQVEVSITKYDTSGTASAGIYLNYTDADNFDFLRVVGTTSPELNLQIRRAGSSGFTSVGILPAFTGTLRVTCTFTGGQFTYDAWFNDVEIGTKTAAEIAGTKVGIGTGGGTGHDVRFGFINADVL